MCDLSKGLSPRLRFLLVCIGFGNSFESFKGSLCYPQELENDPEYTNKIPRSPHFNCAHLQSAATI